MAQQKAFREMQRQLTLGAAEEARAKNSQFLDSLMSGDEVEGESFFSSDDDARSHLSDAAGSRVGGAPGDDAATEAAAEAAAAAYQDSRWEPRTSSAPSALTGAPGEPLPPLATRPKTRGATGGATGKRRGRRRSSTKGKGKGKGKGQGAVVSAAVLASPRDLPDPLPEGYVPPNMRRGSGLATARHSLAGTPRGTPRTDFDVTLDITQCVAAALRVSVVCRVTRVTCGWGIVWVWVWVA